MCKYNCYCVYFVKYSCIFNCEVCYVNFVFWDLGIVCCVLVVDDCVGCGVGLVLCLGVLCVEVGNGGLVGGEVV